jgi:hypothetical protein
VKFVAKYLFSLTAIFLVSLQLTDVTQADSSRAGIFASIAQLTIEPEQWIEQKVVVKGYLAREILLVLYATEDHSQIADYASSIVIVDPESGSAGNFYMGCSNAYAEVSGRFLQRDSELIIDMIEEVRLYDESTDSWSDCWPFLETS